MYKKESFGLYYKNLILISPHFLSLWHLKSKGPWAKDRIQMRRAQCWQWILTLSGVSSRFLLGQGHFIPNSLVPGDERDGVMR